MKHRLNLCLLIVAVLIIAARCATMQSTLLSVGEEGDIGAVQTLLPQGADVNATGDKGETALMGAAFQGHANILKVLLADGADVNATIKDGTTALIIASMEGHTEIVKTLLAHGADVNAKESRGRTALIYAIYNGHTDIVKVLLAEGADIDAKNKDSLTALMIAASNGHTDIVKTLLKEGADVEVKDNDGLSALMIAASNGYTDTVKVLLDNGAGENIKFQAGSKAVEDSIRTAGHLMSMFNIQSTELNKDFFLANHNKIETIRMNLNIIKIKVFSPLGEVIYSTDPKDIGIINKKEYFHEIVAKGKKYAKVVQKDTRSLEDQLMKSDVVETYIPIMDADRFLGAFEIYYDITDRKNYTADLQPL